MLTYRNTNALIGMYLHAMSLHTIWPISVPFGVIHKWQSGINISILTLAQGHEENLDDQSSNMEY